jgi:hypothetical protein
MSYRGFFHDYINGMKFYMAYNPIFLQGRFENHVASLLPKSEFSIIGRSTIDNEPCDDEGKGVEYKPHITATWKPGATTFGIECHFVLNPSDKDTALFFRDLDLKEQCRWSEENRAPLFFVLDDQVFSVEPTNARKCTKDRCLLIFNLRQVAAAGKTGEEITGSRHSWSSALRWSDDGLT